MNENVRKCKKMKEDCDADGRMAGCLGCERADRQPQPFVVIDHVVGKGRAYFRIYR